MPENFNGAHFLYPVDHCFFDTETVAIHKFQLSGKEKSDPCESKIQEEEYSEDPYYYFHRGLFLFTKDQQLNIIVDITAKQEEAKDCC